MSWYNPFSWTPKTWDNIAALASVAAIAIPGLDVAGGLVAIGAGGIGGIENANQGNFVGAGLDVTGVVLSGLGVGWALDATSNLEAGSAAVKGYGYLSPLYESDAAAAAAKSQFYSRFAAGGAGMSFGLNNFVCS